MNQPLHHIQQAYDSSAEAYAEKFLNELEHKPLDRQLLGRFAASVGNAARVLDLGCGPGHTTSYLASLGLDPLGLDLAPGMIAQANGSFPSLRFEVGDFSDLRYPDQAFSGCLAFYCIVHLRREDLTPVFREMRRVLCAGGLLLLSFHVGSTPVIADDFLQSGCSLEFHPFPVDVVESALDEAGFVDVEPLVREPYPTEYPSQRCYLFARRGNDE